jgi:hypothetical protein
VNGDIIMMISSKVLAALLTVAAAPLFAGPAAATPISAPLALQNAVAPSVETVQYRRGYYGGHRGGYRGRGFGGAGVGIVAGALIGSAIVGATRPYGYRGYGPGYAYEPAYGYGPGAGVYAVAPGGDQVAYCLRRFRSYDPGSGTYLGFDGLRHPCP